jgi:hypothetical protein
MEERLQQLLNSLEYKDLLHLQRDLKSGALLTQHVVSKKLNEVETSHRSFCAGCTKNMNVEKDDVYTLVFGDRTVKKKASFCGLDCLHEFTKNIQEEKHNLFKRELRGEHGNF